MTGDLFTVELYTQLRRIAAHHFEMLPSHAKRSTGFDDVFGDALVGLLTVIALKFKEKQEDPKSFDKFCTAVMRKQCQSVRQRWRTAKRTAVAVTSLGELTEQCGDAWIPPIMMSVNADVYPADEAKWKQEQIKEHGRTPLDDQTLCWHCGDPAARLAVNRDYAEGSLRCCYDPRCKTLTLAARKVAEYHADPERFRAARRKRYAAKKARVLAS